MLLRTLAAKPKQCWLPCREVEEDGVAIRVVGQRSLLFPAIRHPHREGLMQVSSAGQPACVQPVSGRVCLLALWPCLAVRQGRCCCALPAGCTRRRGRQFRPRQVAPHVSARWLNQGHHPAHTLVTFSHGKVACHLQIKLSSVAVGREKSVCLCQEMDLEPEVRRVEPNLACSAVMASCRSSCGPVPAADVTGHIACLAAATSTMCGQAWLLPGLVIWTHRH